LEQLTVAALAGAGNKYSSICCIS